MKKIVSTFGLLIFFAMPALAENFEGRIVKMSATYSGRLIEISLDSGQSFNVLSNDPLYSLKILAIVQSAFTTNSKIAVTTQYKDKLASEVIVIRD